MQRVLWQYALTRTPGAVHSRVYTFAPEAKFRESLPTQQRQTTGPALYGTERLDARAPGARHTYIAM